MKNMIGFALIFIVILAQVSPSQSGNSVDFGTLSEDGVTLAYDYGKVSDTQTCYFVPTGSDPITVQIQYELFERVEYGGNIIGQRSVAFANITGEHIITDKASTHTLSASGIDAQHMRIKVISGATGANAVGTICNSGGI